MQVEGGKWGELTARWVVACRREGCCACTAGCQGVLLQGAGWWPRVRQKERSSGFSMESREELPEKSTVELT